MPNTQAGLPLKDHLWKLPSLGTQPTSPRCALAFPRGFATGRIHCDELLVPRRREDDGLRDAAVGRARGPAGWLADGPHRAQTVLALPEPDPSGSMRFVVSRARMWVRCGTRTARPSAATPAGDEISPPMRDLHGNPSQPLRRGTRSLLGIDRGVSRLDQSTGSSSGRRLR